MKIAVLGAGAMGCLCGAYLSKKNQVLMIDSYRPQVEAIRESGIAVVETDGSESYYKENISAFLSGECPKKVDLVIVFVKSTNTETALEENKNLFSDETLVMTLQNGAGNDRKVTKYADSKIFSSAPASITPSISVPAGPVTAAAASPRSAATPIVRNLSKGWRKFCAPAASR